MFDFIKPENKYAAFQNRLDRAYITNPPAAASIFKDGFLYFLQTHRYDLLSNFVILHLHRIQDAILLNNEIGHKNLQQSLVALESSNHDGAALCICNYFGFKQEAVALLSKRGRADDLAMRIAKEGNLDKGVFGTAVANWEKYNGYITKSPILVETILNIGRLSPEYLPDNPRVKEIVGQMEEAALLYEQENNCRDAARCYEAAKAYSKASMLYFQIGDDEGVSRTTEASGDLERALQFVVDPERKLRLLIRMEKFMQAQECAAGMENSDSHFLLIREKAKVRMTAKLKSGRYIEALELAEFAECGPVEKEEIFSAGRKYLDQRLISASSDSEVKAIYQDRVKLEERAGQFEQAGIIAEEILKDQGLASLLYEKANLFNRAIHSAANTEQHNEQGAKHRLAVLHEKGGNLLNAAQLYEQAALYDKAYALYEQLQHYQKASECYSKIANLDENILADLYAKGGEYEKAINTYLKLNTLPDLEKALAIAEAHQFSTHIREINKKISHSLAGNQADLEKCFVTAKEVVASAYSSVLGIDFGTTNSTIAVFNRIANKIEIVPVPGTTDRYYEPSYFGVDERNQLIFGEQARIRALVAPECVAARTKRAIGGDGSFVIGDREYKCEEIAARIIQKMKQNAEAYLAYQVKEHFRELLRKGGFRFTEDQILNFLNAQDFIHINDVVLTVPAFYNNNQKRATRDSAEIAGLRILRLLHEPTAAALAYGYRRSYSGTLAVVDLGGGTLDISILTIKDGLYEIVNIWGDTKLGGSDMDNALMLYAIADIKKS